MSSVQFTNLAVQLTKLTSLLITTRKLFRTLFQHHPILYDGNKSTGERSTKNKSSIVWKECCLHWTTHDESLCSCCAVPFKISIEIETNSASTDPMTACHSECRVEWVHNKMLMQKSFENDCYSHRHLTQCIQESRTHLKLWFIPMAGAAAAPQSQS